jgi:HD-like signal output (HDOD) protein
MIVATKPVLEKSLIGYDLAKGDLWMQGLVVATIAKKIALDKGRKDISDVVFTGGIIHNVGKTILALFVQSTFKDILQAVQTKNITFNQAEKEIMGFNHQEVGEKILEKWNFPPVLKNIVRYYEDPENAPAEYKTEVSIVHLANVIAIMAGIGIGSDGLYHQLSEFAVKTVGMSEEDLSQIYGRTPEMIKQIRDLL